MNRLVTLCLSTLFFGAALGAGRAQAAAPQAIDDFIFWTVGYEEAMALSAKEGRPLLAYFTFKGCDACARMEEEAFVDPAVVALSRKFVMTKVDRYAYPGLVKRFGVRSYPSFLTLGTEEENIYRFGEYMSPRTFSVNLDTALARHARYQKGEDWVDPPTRPELIHNNARVRTMPAPTSKLPGGVAVVDDLLFVAQGRKLYGIDPDTGQEVKTFQLRTMVTDICTDGDFIYAIEYGWTRGGNIYVIDPQTGDVPHYIQTAANLGGKGSSALGIEYHDGRLYVLARRGTIHIVEPETGLVEEAVFTGTSDLNGLAFDGKYFVSTTRRGLVFIEADSLQTLRTIGTNYALRSVAFHDGEYLVMEQPIFDFDKNHKQVQIWPKESLIYSMELADLLSKYSDNPLPTHRAK